MAERPLYTLYKNLKAQNYDVPDDYNKFESALTRDGKGGADNRHAIYENLKAQNFDVPNTYERFYSALFEPRSKTSSRAKGGSVPMTAADRARFSAGAAAISASAQQTMNNAGRYNRLKQRKQKQQKDFGRVNLGTHQTPFGGDANNVVKDDFAYNPETGKAGAYVTSDNENAYTQNDAEQKQNLLDKYGEEWNNAVDMGIVPSELDKADPDLSDTDVAMRQMERRQEWLNENQDRRSNELNESMHLQGSPFVASGGAVAPSSFNTAISNEANRLSDVEYGAYNTAKAYNQMLRTTLLQELKEQKQRNENAGWWKDKRNDVSNYFGAMFNTMLDPKLYSQGIMDAAISNNLLQVKKGMEEGTIKKGSNAGNAAQAMLGAIQQQQGEAAKQQQYGTKAYQYGDMSGRSLKFMADFALSGWRNVVTTGFTKAGEKVGEKMALGALGKWFTKNTGRVLGDIAGSAALAATNQLGSTYNNVIERYVGMNNENGGVTQDKNGDLKFNEGVSLGKAIKDGFGSATIENFSEMFGEYLPGASKLLSKLGLSKVSSFFEKIGNNAYYKWLSNATNKSGIQGVMAEISEEEFGTALHAAWGDGDGSWSDFNVFTNPDAREKQIDTCLGMFYSVGFMQAPRTAVGAINAVRYFNIKHQVAKADKFGQMMFNDKWEDIKSKIDVTTNADLTKTVLDATRSDSMTAKQKDAVINYAMFLSKLRGFNQAADAKTKDKVEEGDTAPTLSNDLDDAYTEGHNADDADKHNIQLEQNDKANELAAMLHITPEQLHDMADEDLEAMTGQDDKLDQAIYDYQVSTAKYQGVMDGAQDEVGMAAQQAAMETDNMTDLSRGTVRKATIKAAGGLEDYEVYIISGNIATHDDGSIDVGNSDDMIIYYDPTTGRKEHADAMMFADLIEELPAADVKAQAIIDAKENAIKKVAGIIDGTVEVGSQFSVTDADGTEHTYEVLADNGDGTAMITIDGNVPTELVKGENVQIPYSFADLQQMKDAEDLKRLEAVKDEREQMEKERAEQQTQETQQTEESQPSFDFTQILNDNGNVVLADVLGKDGNTKYPNSQLFLIRDSGAKAKVMELTSDGSLIPHAVNKKDVRTATTITLDEYKQAFAGSSMIEDNSGTIEADRGGIEVDDNTQPLSEADADNVIAQMESSAETAPDLELTPDNWAAEFGEDGIVSTPIGDVKMGENQVAKLFEKGRSKEFGMIKPTLTNPDVIIEVPSHSAEGNEERSSSYLFIKTFLGKNGKKVYYFKSVTIKKDGLEISISSHYDRAKRVKEALMKGKLLYRKNDGAQTEQNQPSTSVTTSQEDAAGSSESKDTNISANGNENNESLTFEDGTPIPVDVNGETDLSQTDAAHAAEWYDNNLGEDADDWLDGEIKKAKKVLEQAQNKKVTGTKPSELVASKKEKEAAIADAQAHYDSAISIRDALKERQLAKVEDTAEGRKELIEKARRKFARLKSAMKDDAEAVAQLYKETVGNLLHRLYDGTGIDVTDTIPLTAEEYVASNLGAHSLNYEGTETSKGVKQETGLNREDFAKTQLLAADGKGTTIDNLVHSLWENRPSNLDALDTQDIRNAMLSVITSGFKASEARNYIENLRIAQAENFLEEQKKAADNAAFAEENKAEPEQQTETAPESEEKAGEENFDEINDEENEKINEQTNENINAPEVPEDATAENPLGEQRPEEDLPFSARDNGTQQTTSERAADVEKNKVDDMKVVDNIVGEKTRKAFERLAKMMGASIQWQYSDKLGNGWIQETTDADGNVHRTIFITLDSSITEGAQFIFGHEMTHQIKNLNPAAYNELTQLVLDTYGSDAFDKAVDETMQRYSDAGFSGRARDYYAEEVVADAVGEMIRDLNLAHTLAMKMSHPLLAAIHEILQKIKLAFFGTEYSDVTKNIIRSIEQAYVKTAKGEVTNSETGEDVSFSLRQKPEPKKKGIGYKVFVLKDGKLYPPMVANPNGAATPVGVWLDADAAPIAGESKTGRPQVKQGGKGTQGGSGKLAYRPGWHLGVVPYAIQFNRKDADGNKTLFPKNFVFAEVEYAADVDYQEEARQEGINPSGKYQHSLAGLKHLPTDGYYMYRTNPNPETDPWVITGAMKVNRILTRAEQADLVSKAGREPQQIQEGDIVTDDIVNSINQEIADAPKFSIKTYHGSQASFDKFDHSFMGSGEGAQAYGWGTYVSEVEGIAKAYAKQNAAKHGMPREYKIAQTRLNHAKYEYDKVQRSYDNSKAYIDSLKEDLQNYKESLARRKEKVAYFAQNDMPETVDKLLKQIKRTEETIRVTENDINQRTGELERWKPKLEEAKKKYEEEQKKFDAIPKPQIERNLYSVDIPDDTGENYIGWDDKMTPRMRDIRKEILEDNGYKLVDSDEVRDYFEDRDGKEYELFKEKYKTGGTFYEELAKLLHSQKLASLALKEYGFVGVKVIAQRNTGGNKEGKMNYVIFDENNALITSHTKFSLKKDGLTPEIANTPVNIVDADEEHGFKNYAEAREWAKKNIVRTYNDEETGGKGEINISNTAVGKYLSEKAIDKSISKDVHMSVLKVLPSVLRESVDAYQHGDRKKVNNVRSEKFGINPDVMIHRCFGAVNIGGKVYGVKITLKENVKTRENKKLYSYEATKIELLDGKNEGVTMTPSLNSNNSITVAKIAKVFETTKKNGEKVDVEEPKTFEEFLNHPSLKFSIKNEEQRKAAEDAYEYASKLRPNKYAQYALVDMSNPSNSPEYYEKKVLADRWRRFYNKAVHNELDDVYKDAWGNYKLFDLDRPFADQVNEVKGDVPSEFNAPDVVANKNADNESGAEYHEYKQGGLSSVTYEDRYKAFKQREANREKVAGLKKELKETEDSYNLKGKERAEYQKQLMKEYMDKHKMTEEYEIPDDDWEDLRSKSFEKYQDELDSLFNKYKDLDRQIKAVAEPRFSLKDEKTLAGVHNITEEKLRKALKLGGFANPSLAVIDTNKSGHDNFGEISFIAPSALLDKRTGNTGGTWITDAYTQRYPSVEREMSEKGYRKFEDWVDSLDYPSGAKAEIERQAKDALSDNNAPAWELMYLKEKGIDIKEYDSRIDYRWKEIISDHPTAEDILNSMKTEPELNEKVTSLAKHAIIHPTWEKVSLEVRRKMYKETGVKASPINPQVRKQTKEIFERDYAPTLLNKDGSPRKKDVKKVVEDIVKEHNDTKKYDFYLSKVKASNYVNKNGLYDDYIRWQENKLDEFGTKNRIFRGYTRDGSRKYVPETLENVSKVMREEADGQTNGSEYTSFGSFIAKLASRVDSTDEMRANKDKLSSNKDKEEFYEKWSEVYYDLAKFLYNDVFYGEQRLHDIVLQSDPKKYAKKEYGITLTPTFMKKLDALKNAVQTELKSAYFETKYNRPLRLNEFAAAVVPDNLGEDVRKGIENAGLPMYDYDPNKEGDRSRAFNEAINSSDNIRFSLKSMMAKPEGWKQANKKAIHIAEAIERDPKFSLKNLDGTLIKAGTYFSGGGLVEEGLKGIIDPVVAVEYDEKISGVYRNNFGQHIVTADVRDVDPRELVKQIDGEVEYFHASPVCKNYSQAKSNHAEVELDKETAASTAEFINAIKPKVVTIENVKGYKDSDAMKTITDALDANGYTWDADVYNAADYGGYSNRERLIVRAVRDGKLPAKPKKMAHKSGWYEAVADIIPTLTEKKNGVAPWMDVRLKADGIDWRNIDKPLYVMGSAYADGKIPHAFADELLPTLRTKSGDVIVMPDGKVYRAMGRVLARVSGVSDDYKMPFSENLSHTIIGNGIPTQLTEHVIAPLLTGSDPKFSIRTYHGTGASFDKFDFSHMGEGEGSQAFGWGGYVTNSKDIAEDYTRRAKIRKDNGGFEFVTDMSANNKDMVRQYIYKHKDVNKGLDAMRKDLSSALEMFPDDDDLKELSNILAKKNEEIAVPDNIAYLYDMDIPDDNGSNYLYWDAPLTDKQKNTIIKELRRLKIDFADFKKRGFSFDGSFGGNSYDFLMYALRRTKKWQDVNTSRAVSKFLSSIGFTGIKYKAGSIFGGAKEDDYNYVIFDENNANIVGNTRFSLRYDKFEHDLNQWKKDNNLPKDAQRPTIPQRNAGESAVDFLRRVDEYRKQMALWKTAPTYEQHLLSDDTALGEFNRELQRGSVLKRIAFQDSMLAIRKAQEAIMNEVGVDRLNMAEDAYTAENRSHGKGKNEFEEYNNEFLQPLRKAYHKMKKILGDSYDNVRIYMMAKHGLERDAQMAFKKSLDADFEDVAQRSAAYRAYKGDMNRITNDSDLEFGRVDFNTWRQRDNALRTKYSPSYMDYRYDENGIAYDYSGLSALFGGSDFEEAAHKLVRDIESSHVAEVQDLWNATNAATKKILRDGYKAGMMSKDTYLYVRDMYSHYIPLRGWDGTTADQVWDYVGGGEGAFNQTLKTAHGRTSIADDPIAYIENMAESGILLNNKNWVKQHLMLLAQNHPTSLLTLSKAWYVKSTDANGNEEWIPATPQITSQMNSNQVKAAIDAFEQKMENMAQTGDATQQRDGLNIVYPQTHSEEREHEVRVMKDGEEYVIYVNGDPQLAQAMNNTRAHRVREIQSGKLDRAAAWLGRKMAAAYTSLSPLFIPSNYFRDLTMTLASTAIREDGRYNYLLRKNLATSWNLGFMLRDYQSGKLREKISNGNATPKEQMFYDFMMNGGETGFVSSLDVEDLKKKFKNDLKDLDRWKTNPVKVGHTIMDGIEFLNRAIEDSNRFAVYMTSIQYGRSIDEAVNDAKDVTLNFNRKGTGEYGWQMIRNLYLFINPSVQSLQTLGALAKHHPFKFTAVTASWLTSGVLVPIVNAALMSLLGGDDDKDKYWQFTKWDRRNNLIMWVPFTHEYVKIPLAQEFRAFYGVGDMIASKIMGGELAEESWSQYAEDLLGQVVDMLPLDPTGYDGNIAVSLMPNAIRPVFELAFNVDFTGKPLFKETEYNKYDPNFTKAYVGTPDWLVRASKMVNSIGNDYPDVQQNSIDAFGDPRYNLNNPAVVDHVLSSYLGGAYTMGSQVLGVLTKSLNDPKEIKVADIPLFSKFVSNPDDRPVTKKQGDEFWDMKENHDRAANTLSKLKKQAKVDGDYSMLERFYDSEEYKQYKQDDVKVKKYEEDKKKERAEESGEEYRPHKLNAEDIYKAHATPKDDFEDLKLKQLYTKLNGFKSAYDLLVDTAPSQSDGYYNTNKAAIDAIDEISLDKQEISELKKGFLDDGKDAYNAEDMKQIRELRKKILSVLEKANKVVVANQKAKDEK
nr:MAG TPA: Cytosine specific methyltransferase [Caudoviricetes sp.]